jgi:uncharacterized membrane protein YfcA
MDVPSALLILLAGVGAGMINAIVGSGSLITFPTLLLLGYPPLVANVSNTVGLVPGSVSAAYGYRRELAGQRSRAIPLCIVAGAGGLTGAYLLLTLPASAFETIVPALILLACAMVAVQPRISRYLASRPRDGSGQQRLASRVALLVGVFMTGVYGGYFGAAQGVILIALLSMLIVDDLQRLNALKNIIAACINGIAAVLFLFVAPVALPVALLIAAGATTGGLIGASVGRRLSPQLLRGAIIVVGVTVAIRFLVD